MSPAPSSRSRGPAPGATPGATPTPGGTPAAGQPPLDTSAPFILLGDQGERSFDAVTLEQELQVMWKSHPEAASGASESGAFYRAALANVIVPQEREEFDRLAPVVADMARRHPARLFRIGPAARAPRDPDQLLARATALCHMREGGGGFVCSEQVILEYTDQTASLVPSAVRALLIGDLPVVLLAMTPEPRTPWLEALVGMSDVVIADSCVERDSSGLAAVWARTGRKGAPMHDLAWARLEPWRAAVAGIFDDPAAARSLPELRDVTIVHGGAYPPSPAWLLAGWLAARLGWELRSRSGGSFKFECRGVPVDLSFVREERESRPALSEIRVRAAGSHPLDVRLSHEGREDTARLECLAPTSDVRSVVFPWRELAAAVVGEIQRQRPNEGFQEAARVARKMLER